MNGETKEQRFKRVATKRVHNVLDSIRKLSQCSNRRMYAWNEEQLATIWKAIDQEITRCRARFETEEPEEFIL
jgi:hypothetical protein